MLPGSVDVGREFAHPKRRNSAALLATASSSSGEQNASAADYGERTRLACKVRRIAAIIPRSKVRDGDGAIASTRGACAPQTHAEPVEEPSFATHAICATLSPMPEEWIIRVNGKEYGPADLSTLREWKAEGRVLAENEVRRSDSESWDKAERIPGLFESERPPVQATRPQLPTAISTRKILPETFAIYTRGFFKYLGLTLLVLGPSICAQLTGAFVDSTPGANADMRTLIVGAFALCMLLLSVVLTPVYIAGIQILTAAYAAGERISFFATLNEAVKFWPRVAFLWVFVFLCYAFWTVMPTAVILTIALSGPSLLAIFLALLVLSVMVWVTGRLFINFMFWQQFAVLEGSSALEALRRSRELARSQRDLPWFRRPLWRGVIIASLWFALVLALNWPSVSQAFLTISGATDPQTLMEALRNGAKSSGTASSTFAATVLQAILKPLLGIAFVLLFLDSNFRAGEE